MHRSAKVCRVQVEAYVQELATEMTESVITVLKINGRTWMLVALIAKMKDEAAVLLLEALSRFSLS